MPPKKAMEITLERLCKKDSYTIGRMSLNGKYFCDTLEDPVRDIAPDGSGKVPGKTAVPEGRYKIFVDESPRFKRLLPRLLAVPHFIGVRIHAGNTASDTEGCILVGENKAKGKVLDSRTYEARLVSILLNCQREMEPIHITIS